MPATDFGDVKTLITSKNDIPVGYFYGVYNIFETGYLPQTVQVNSSLVNSSITVNHISMSVDEGDDGYDTQVGIIYVQVPLSTFPTFRLSEDGIDYTADCVWHNAGDYINYIGDPENITQFECPADGYYYRVKNIKTDSYIIVDNGEGDVVSPFVVPITVKCYGNGVLNLRNSDGEDVETATDGEEKTANWTKYEAMTLAVTAPEGVDFTNYEAYLLIDGVESHLEKTIDTDGKTVFNTVTMENIATAHTIILVMKQTGGFASPDIIEFASAAVKAVCVEHWDTDGDGELSMAEAEAVTSLESNTFLNLRHAMGSTHAYDKNFSFDEFQYFTNVTSLPDNLFYAADSLVSIVLPPNLNSIGNQVFASCDKLKSLVIPESVKYLGSSIFHSNWGLEKVVLPPNISSIPKSAFYNCKYLTNIVLPKKITSIGESAFMFCNAITNIDLPETLRTIGQQAFSGSGLRSVFIPKNVSSIGDYAFISCQSLASIVVDDDNATFATPDNGNVIINKSSKMAIVGTCYAKIPEGTTTIAKSAFRNELITSIVLPASITQIQTYAFWDCPNLTSVVSKIFTPFQLEGTPFYNISPNCVLTVPKGTKQAYIDAGWTEDIFKGGIVEAEDESTGVPGDLNNDGEVNVGDVTKLVNEILGK